MKKCRKSEKTVMRNILKVRAELMETQSSSQSLLQIPS